MGYKELPGSLGVALTRDGELRARRGSVGRARVRLLPAQQARRVGELPQPCHAVRAEDLPVPVAETLSHVHGCATAFVVCGQTCDAATEAAQRRSARTGRTAGAPPTWTGWAGTPTPTSSCCGRCRARPTPTARCARSSGWPRRSARTGTNSTRRCSRTKALRGRLFGVLGSSLALGDHLVAHPQSWHLLAGDVTLPSADELRADVHRRAPKRQRGTQRLRCRRCASCTATGCWCWRPWTWRRRWRTSRCCRSPTVGEHLSDLADAALGAALTVATRSVCGDDGAAARGSP